MYVCMYVCMYVKKTDDALRFKVYINDIYITTLNNIDRSYLHD